MSISYGVDSSEIGTTNLHIDISDALNVLVYVSVAKRSKGDPTIEQFEYLDGLSDLDKLTKERIRERESEIGALWHIYEAKDADKLRSFLKQVSSERKERVPSSGDPIHDQSFYLNSSLRERLKKEYNVVGYSVVQLLGSYYHLNFDICF